MGLLHSIWKSSNIAETCTKCLHKCHTGDLVIVGIGEVGVIVPVYKYYGGMINQGGICLVVYLLYL